MRSLERSRIVMEASNLWEEKEDRYSMDERKASQSTPLFPSPPYLYGFSRYSLRNDASWVAAISSLDMSR